MFDRCITLASEEPLASQVKGCIMQGNHEFALVRGSWVVFDFNGQCDFHDLSLRVRRAFLA